MIESTQNEIIKKARALHQKKGREEQGLHFIEGVRLVEEAVNSGAAVISAFLEEGHEELCERLQKLGVNVTLVTRKVMESMSQTETPQWICACVKTPESAVPEKYPQGLLVALDCVQDPGNLGTILRTADAMGACGLLLGKGCADAYSPKTLRAGMGSTYHLPVWKGDLSQELLKLKQQDFTLICGHLKGSSQLPVIKRNCVLIIGNEGNGVSERIADHCSLYRLPMYGRAESLNASVAAGILMYAVVEKMHCGDAIPEK